MSNIKNRTAIQSNSNFHSLSGNSFFENNKEMMIYREKWEKNPKTFFVEDFPLFIDLEVTNTCNLKCPFCFTTIGGNKIEKGFVADDIVTKVIDEGAANGLYGVKFNIRGEPLLHKNIANFVKYAKKKKLIDVYFNTNGTLLKENVVYRLIDAGLDRISISFEGHTKKIYEKCRVGANYEDVVENIKNIKRIKDKLKVSHPKVRVQTISLPEKEWDIVEYKNFWEPFVDEVSYLDYQMMRKKEKNLKFSWGCSQLWQRMAVWWDGTILVCNHDFDGISSMGKVGETSIKNAWNNIVINSIRNIHKNGKSHILSMCNGCFLRTSEIRKMVNNQNDI